MRAPLSIVIPTLNAAAPLPGTLAALAEGLDAGLIRELVISDGGSTDATRDLAEAAGALWVEGPPSRGAQLRKGVEASEGVWVLALHADTHLSAGWSDAVLDHLRDAPQKAGYFALGFRAAGTAPKLVAAWANLRSRWFGLPYGDQGLLLPRALYNRVGGYPNIPLMEDVALIRTLGGALVPIAGTAWTGAERYQKAGWVRRGARNIWTLLRYLFGADPKALLRAYQR